MGATTRGSCEEQHSFALRPAGRARGDGESPLSAELLRGRSNGPLDLAFVDREVDEAGEHAERDRYPPDDVVTSRVIVEPATEPRAEEAADLVGEEREPGEH